MCVLLPGEWVGNALNGHTHTVYYFSGSTLARVCVFKKMLKVNIYSQRLDFISSLFYLKGEK